MTDKRIAPPGFIAYPDPSDVFADEVDRHLQVLHPVLTIPAAKVDPAWEGVFHFVLPVEPLDGALGETSDDHFGVHCGIAWIKLIREKSRYRFAGDWGYFHINREHDDDVAAGYAAVNQDYAQRRRAWLEEGVIGGSHFDWVAQIGGHAGAGNWSGDLRTREEVARWNLGSEYLLGEHETLDGERVTHPLTDDGRRYRFVGKLYGYDYREHGADSLMLFYDPPSDSVLIMLNFT